MEISIIIVNHNTKKDLKECIESVYDSLNASKLSYEIFVVDNGSHDGSSEMVEKDFSSVNLIKNTIGRGFTKANNQAIKVANGDYILLLNPDTLVLGKPFEKMIQYLKENKAVGILAPRLLDEKKKVWTSTGDIPTPYTVFLHFSVPRILLSPKIKSFIKNSPLRKLLGKQVEYYFFSKQNSVPLEVGFASGACLLIKKEVIEKIGGLDENFFLGSDDSDFCLRTRRAGWKVVYYPEAEIIHYAGHTVGSKDSPYYFCHRTQSACYFFKKNYDKSTALKVKFFLILGLIIKFPEIVYWSLFKNKKEKNLLKLYLNTFKKIII